MPRVDITVVGAGVVGLAVAAQVATSGRQVLLLEKNSSFGEETSSRHSGVIHAGIYYPENSLKASLCVRGNALLYQMCRQWGIPFKKVGKLILATEESEVGQLETLLQQGTRNGVPGLKLLSRRELKELEPNVEGVAALFSRSTGIIDAHSLMSHFLSQVRERGALVAFRKEVIGVEKKGGDYGLTVREHGGRFALDTRVLINCAGLYSDSLAEMVGIDIDRVGYRLHYCKGEYFSLSAREGTIVRRLVYPVPDPQGVGLGTHITLDLEGRIRLGPNANYVDRISYNVDSAHKESCYRAVARLLPAVQESDLEPESAGIRPKLQGPGQGFRDFVIHHEEDRGFPGLINLIGIESPGLTAAPAIGEFVVQMVEGLQ